MRALAYLILLAPLVAAAGRSADRSEVQALAREYGVILLPPEDPRARWSPESVAAIREGIERLPAPMRRAPGGPLRFAIHPHPTRFGMGAGEATPEWTGDLSTFHLFEVARGGEPISDRRLGALEPGERERLWRQRAVVHAIMERWDAALRLSDRQIWRRLSGWPLARGEARRTERPGNIYDGAYSRLRGRESAAEDLATFAEELFVPPSAIRRQRSVEAVRCREPSKARALESLLEEAGLGTRARPEPCEAFESWADPESLSHLEVLFVVASGRTPESVFGHVLLWPVRRKGETVRSPSFESVVQIAAITDGPEAGLSYLARGVAGGYPMTVLTLSAGDFFREALEYEQRTVRRFRLNLSAEQSVQLLERVWELERRGWFDYRFFTDNCATLLVELIEAVLPEGQRVRLPGWGPVGPTAVLDALASHSVGVGDGRRPLLEHVPDDAESTGERAARAERRREQIEKDLVAARPAEGGVWGPALKAARASDPLARAAAYEQLAALTRAELPTSANRRPLYEWWALTVLVERYALDRAENERLQVQMEAIERGEIRPVDPAAEARSRQELFDSPGLGARQMLLDRQVTRAERLLSARRRALTAAEQEIVDAAEAAGALFARVTELHGELVAEVFATEDGQAWLDSERARAVEERRMVDSSALSRSGAWRAAVGAEVSADDPRRPSARLALRSALLAEELGDQRVHGIRSGTEMRILDAELALGVREGRPGVQRSRLTLFGYRSLQREPPMLRRDLLDELGWGFAFRWDTWPTLKRQRLSAHLEALPILAVSQAFDGFAVLGVGVGTVGDLGVGTAAAGGGPRLSFTGRLPLRAASPDAIRLEASWLPALLWGRGVRLEHALRASAGLDWRLRAGSVQMLLSPRFEVEALGAHSSLGAALLLEKL